MSAKYFSDEFVDEITKTAIKSTSSKKNGRYVQCKVHTCSQISYYAKYIELDSGLVFWARLKGFPDWPARMCSLAEGDALRKKMQAQPPAKDSVAVSFLGIKCEKYVCMHVCMYVCISCNMFSYPVAVRMYVCMYVCMYAEC